MSGVAYAVGLPDHVALFPPYERSSGWHRHTRQPLARGPRYAQGPGRGDTPGYWHRVRSAVQRGDGRITLYLWCGQTARHGNMRYRLDDPDGDVCGTCIGRALGAGQDVTPADLPNLAFHPAGVTPPSRCPGERFYEAINPRVGRCLVCGSMQPLRAVGGPYNSSEKLVTHEPEGDPAGWCPFHAWDQLTVVDGDVVCRCQRKDLRW